MSTAARPRLRNIGDMVARCVTYRHVNMEPGTHLGLPSPSLTLVFAIGPPTRLAVMPDPEQEPRAFMTLVGGLHMSPVVIAYDDTMCGIQLDITPQAARRLFGVPAADLVHGVFDMHDVLGPIAGELLDRLHTADAWGERVDAVDDVLGRGPAHSSAAPSRVDDAWRLLCASHGAMSTGALAGAVGWSRRHLDREFRAEFGLTPKEVARLARFTHSRNVLQRDPTLSMVDLSAQCGYFDQSHMAREWNLLAGVPASTWWATEGVQFFQAAALMAAAS